jgi:PhnB protein
MIKVNPYLNYAGKAEEAFSFYKSVFGGEFSGLFRMKDSPQAAELSEEERNHIMHISLPISDNVTLMASDVLCNYGHTLTVGNNVQISIHPDSREEADRLFKGLSAGGNVIMPMEDTFWGDYFGSFTDKFGVNWMVNYSRH